MESRRRRLWFSPSDLSEYLGCATPRISRSRTRASESVRATPTAKLIFPKGNEHEAAYLERLRGGRRASSRSARAGRLRGGRRAHGEADARRRRRRSTRASSWSGLARPRRLRRAGRGAPGARWSYEAVDTKLARAERLPSHVLQLCFYSDGIERMQGARPSSCTSSSAPAGASRSACASSTRTTAARAPFEAPSTRRPATAFPCEHCQFCDFQPECEDGVARRGPPRASRRHPPRPDRRCSTAPACATLAELADARAGPDRVRRPAAGDARGGCPAGTAPARQNGHAPPVRAPRARGRRGFARLPGRRRRRDVRPRGRSVLDARARADVPVRPALARRRRLELPGVLGAHADEERARLSSTSIDLDHERLAMLRTCTSSTTAPAEPSALSA